MVHTICVLNQVVKMALLCTKKQDLVAICVFAMEKRALFGQQICQCIKFSTLLAYR